MCRLNEYDGLRPSERAAQLRCDIINGQARVHSHMERLRLETPRLFATLKPLLDDLDQWMCSVGAAFKDDGNRLYSLEITRGR